MVQRHTTMSGKFSESFIYSVFDFARAVQKELGDEFSEERMEQILDAIDPGIKRQMLLEMISGNTGHLRIRRTRTEGKSPITAIKAVRSVSGLPLKDAKHVVDTATAGSVSTIPGNYDSAHRRNFVEMLIGTGYEVV